LTRLFPSVYYVLGVKPTNRSPRSYRVSQSAGLRCIR